MQIGLRIDLPELGEMLEAEARDVLRDVTIRTTDRMRVKHADSPATGAIYQRGRFSFHRASAPGEPPAVDSGNLLGSIQSEIDPQRLTAEISLNLYGWYLETGAGAIEARPWIMPSLEEILNEVL